MDISTGATLLAIGVFGGMWNAIAGGATLFTFPALMAAGLPPMVANATNYLALMPANAAALLATGDDLRKVGFALVPLLIVSGLGAIAGSLLLLISEPELFLVLIPFLILLATGLFAFGETLRAWLVRSIGETSRGVWVHAALFVCCIYGGYFGAGLGIVLLAIAQIIGYSDFHTANAIKNLLATSFTVLSVLVFGAGGLIAWPEAIVMMSGSAMGGYVSGRYAKYVNQSVLRGLVIAFGLLLSAVYFVRTFG